MTLTIPAEADLPLHELTHASGLRVRLFPDGTLFAIEHDGVMINQLLGTPLGEQVVRIVLRRREGGAVVAAATLVGPGSTASVAMGGQAARWSGQALGVGFVVTLQLHPDPRKPAWQWAVALGEGAAGTTFDLVLVQDVGLASRGQILNNEAYTSQYLDHAPLRHERVGWAVASRQNLPQGGGRCPWLVQWAEPAAASFATDGLASFGPAFRATGVAELARHDLPGRRVQHEASWIALQSTPLRPGETGRFIAVYEPDHPAATSEADLSRIEPLQWPDVELPAPALPQRTPLVVAPPLACEPLSDLRRWFGGPWRHEERLDGQLASFFTAEGHHVVLPVKELASPRRSGHLLRTAEAIRLDETVFCSTAWMAGVFASQVTLGNTSFHKLLSVARDGLHAIRFQGLRLLVKLDGSWRLLAMPSAFEMGLHHCRWLYAFTGRTLVVHAEVDATRPRLSVTATIEGQPLELLWIAHVIGGNHEYEARASVAADAGACLTIRPDAASMFGRTYPDASYTIRADDPACVAAQGREHLPDHAPHLTVRTRAVERFTLILEGQLQHSQPIARQGQWPRLIALTHEAGDDPRLLGWAALADSLPWLTHNAMVHLTAPRGLEQYSGAAWGVRDVAQGPVEFLLSVDRADLVRDILQVLFSQQWADTHDWPQWFMHAPYAGIRDQHSHGDVIVWPLKALCDYLEHTADFSLLDEPLAYFDRDGFRPTDRREPLREHVERLLARVQRQFIPGTSLIRYGEGDWNDALQPADPSLRDTMVSSWTVALLYHTLRRWAVILQHAGGDARPVETLRDAVGSDYHRHLVHDGVVAGYAIFDPHGQVQRRLLHPSDTTTGIRYSLIPMTRGILAHLFTPRQAREHLALIREHLLAPDGARLMDRPPRYRGGVMTLFRRAESSSFFGREIGLQYTHAHLRYGEALAELGEAASLHEALLTINPIAVADVVASAAPRQRNSYFSSSDATWPGGFADRYEADARYDAVRRGEVTVHGGWRVYSSGPGICIQLIVQRLLGLRRWFGQTVIDPVLPRRLDGLTVRPALVGRTVRYQVESTGARPGVAAVAGVANPRRLINPYRPGGFVLDALPPGEPLVVRIESAEGADRATNADFSTSCAPSAR